MRKIGAMLGAAVEQEEALRGARAKRVLDRWAQIVGPGLASRSHPDRYQKGVVFIAVSGSAWAQELRLMRDNLLRKLRDAAGEPDLFVDLRFGVRPLPEAVVVEEIDNSEEEARIAALRKLSIREIGAKRLANWPKDD